MPKGEKSRYRYGDTPLAPKEKVYQKQMDTHDNQGKYSVNSFEDRMADAIDQKRAIERFMEWKEKLATSKTDIMGFLQGLAPEVAVQMMLTCFDPKVSEKTQFAARQDILDRAGYGKVNKHAVAAVDETSSKEAIMSLIEGSKDSVKDVIEFIDDEDDESDNDPETSY